MSKLKRGYFVKYENVTEVHPLDYYRLTSCLAPLHIPRRLSPGLSGLAPDQISVHSGSSRSEKSRICPISCQCDPLWSQNRHSCPLPSPTLAILRTVHVYRGEASWVKKTLKLLFYSVCLSPPHPHKNSLDLDYFKI